MYNTKLSGLKRLNVHIKISYAPVICNHAPAPHSPPPTPHNGKGGPMIVYYKTRFLVETYDSRLIVHNPETMDLKLYPGFLTTSVRNLG